jgi:hypothetical protein
MASDALSLLICAANDGVRFLWHHYSGSYINLHTVTSV